MAKEVTFNQLNKYLGIAPKIIARELLRETKSTAGKIKNQYRRNARKRFKTGEMNSAIVSDNDGQTFEVGNTTLQSVFIEFGTKPHVIERKHAPYLTFFWPKIGKWVRAIRVKHPGTKAYLPLTKAWVEYMSGNDFARRVIKRLDKQL